VNSKKCETLGKSIWCRCGGVGVGESSCVGLGVEESQKLLPRLAAGWTLVQANDLVVNVALQDPGNTTASDKWAADGRREKVFR